MTRRSTSAGPISLAFWYGKGGVGKSTTTLLLSLLLARQGERVLVVDLDPECGTSRDFLGKALPRVPENLKTLLESPVPLPLPILATGIEALDLVPGAPDQQRFFRLYPEHSTRLSEALALSPPEHDWILMDVPNQFDNVAELGLIAADYLILPVELTADCRERAETALRIIAEARALHPTLVVLGALTLASTPRAGRDKRLSAKERMIFAEYEQVFGDAGIKLFRTVMFRTAMTVEEARSASNERLLHWTARRRFLGLLTEIRVRIHASRRTSFPHAHGIQPARPHRTVAEAGSRAA
jgi:chromosome partitioning protein